MEDKSKDDQPMVLDKATQTDNVPADQIYMVDLENHLLSQELSQEGKKDDDSSDVITGAWEMIEKHEPKHAQENILKAFKSEHTEDFLQALRDTAIIQFYISFLFHSNEKVIQEDGKDFDLSWKLFEEALECGSSDAETDRALHLTNQALLRQPFKSEMWEMFRFRLKLLSGNSNLKEIDRMLRIHPRSTMSDRKFLAEVLELKMRLLVETNKDDKTNESLMEEFLKITSQKELELNNESLFKMQKLLQSVNTEEEVLTKGPKSTKERRKKDRKFQIRFDNDGEGRKWVATQDINLGEVIHVEEPLFVHSNHFLLHEDDEVFRCHVCMTEIRNPHFCLNCSDVCFCTDCDQRPHEILCQYKETVDSLQDTNDHQTLQLIFNVVARKDLDFFVNNQNQFLSIDKTKAVNLEEDSCDELSKYKHVFSLVELKPDLSKAVGFGMVSLFLVEILKRDGYFSKSSDEKSEQLLELIFYKLLNSVTINSIPITKETDDQKLEATGIYSNLVFLNHSCIPNAFRAYRGKQTFLVALRPIRKGREIVDSYSLNFAKYPAHNRKHLLSQSFGFTCSCLACQENWDTTEELLMKCPKCLKDVSLELKVKKCPHCHHHLRKQQMLKKFSEIRDNGCLSLQRLQNECEVEKSFQNLTRTMELAIQNMSWRTLPFLALELEYQAQAKKFLTRPNQLK